MESTVSGEATPSQAASSEQSTPKTSSKKASSVKNSSKASSAATSSAYKRHENDDPNVSDELGKKLREDFVQYCNDHTKYKSDQVTIDDVWVKKYYGTVGGIDVVRMQRPAAYILEAREINVAGYKFLYMPAGGPVLMVHKESTFMHINKAYENGFISKENVKQIYNITKDEVSQQDGYYEDWIHEVTE